MIHQYRPQDRLRNEWPTRPPRKEIVDRAEEPGSWVEGVAMVAVHVEYVAELS